MPWWKGMKCKISKEKAIHVNTLKEALNDFVQPAKREGDKEMRLPLSGVYKIKGVGDVLTGRVEQGEVKSGDNIGMNVKALNKDNMPRVGDVMVYKADETIQITKNFTAQVQILDIPGEIKCGYSPIGHVRCGRAACRLVQINWKMGKDTGGEKAEGAVALKTNDAAEGIFEP